MRIKNKIFCILVGVLVLAFSSSPDVLSQSGGPYQIEKSVIASGGGTSSGGVFGLDGATGQSLAGGRFTGQPFSIYSGFFAPDPIVPTAAKVPISGKVMRPNGKGINRAHVTLTDMLGNTRMANTDRSGNYRFEDVEVGAVYLLLAEAKSYQFSPKVVTLFDEVSDLDFTAE